MEIATLAEGMAAADLRGGGFANRFEALYEEEEEDEEEDEEEEEAQECESGLESIDSYDGEESAAEENGGENSDLDISGLILRRRM